MLEDGEGAKRTGGYTKCLVLDGETVALDEYDRYLDGVS
jgi:hypothetical protein